MSDWEITGYRVVVRQEPINTKSKGGIILDVGDAAKRRQGGQVWGYLEAMGEIAFTGKDFGPSDREIYEKCMKEKRRVLFRRYAGQVIAGDEEKPDSDVYHICADSDILMPSPKGKMAKLVH